MLTATTHYMVWCVDRKVNYMQKINQFARRLRSDKKGATAIEYGLLAALISVAMIATVTQVGDQLGGTFGYVQGKLSDANNGAG